ncbi:MAG: hypothetical protein QNI84_15980 [Henriciella sp.]|nr:hypothetical protein [Henriciella sp.]
MFRFISLLLVIAGAVALWYGGQKYLAEQSGGDRAAAMDSAPAEMAGPSLDSSPSPSLTDSVPNAVRDSLNDIVSTSSASDELLESLRTVPIAHETPRQARFGRAFEVTVAIDGTGGDSAADALPGEGNIVEGEARVSADVRATLSGENFDIESVTPLIQTVSPLTENIWRWRVTPLEAGAQELVIELFALDGDRAMPVRTFRDRVEVQVSPVGQAIAVADSLSPVAVVVGGVGSLLAGLLGLFRFFRGG